MSALPLSDSAAPVEPHPNGDLGALSALMANSLNNLLTSVMGFAELARTSGPPAPELDECLSNLLEASERISRRVQQRESVRVHHDPEPRLLSLHDRLREMQDLLPGVVGPSFAVEMKLAEAAGEGVLADPAYVWQCLLYWAMTVRVYFPMGAQIRLSTDLVDECQPPRIRLRVQASGTATGDSPRWSGPLLYDLVQRMGAEWESEKIDRHHVEMAVLFASAPSTPAPSDRLADHEKTVLVVDDDEAVRRVSVRQLRAQGYVVYEAANGPEALTWWNAASRPPVDLVFTDLVMPMMDGPDMIREMEKTQRPLNVLYTSGYANGIMIPPRKRDVQAAFLGKPYSSEELALKVRQALSAH